MPLLTCVQLHETRNQASRKLPDPPGNSVIGLGLCSCLCCQESTKQEQKKLSVGPLHAIRPEGSEALRAPVRVRSNNSLFGWSRTTDLHWAENWLDQTVWERGDLGVKC
ncbi:hypothetical protein KFK09_026886 [Dendrobium nobile]|uniref:Uncharacterized protein n=1 Tax=Dendrobium nobile TaxID=94219 RepID=A0A8T3A8T2_DENNO|nr:hypothetical protein KFK09_026886 [Dendrobium nobile]